MQHLLPVQKPHVSERVLNHVQSCLSVVSCAQLSVQIDLNEEDGPGMAHKNGVVARLQE